ncbi:MAG: methionyl-tRNA formyltransferase [Elusimicrobiota bacterium]
MKLLFVGTPAVAVPFLELCAGSEKHELLAALSQPDRPAGRGMRLRPTPVKAAAEKLGIKVFQPKKVSDIAEELRALKPDLAVVVAYGRMLKPKVLGIPRLGFLNVHYSLLPRYRGAAPVQRALMAGEALSGVTLFWIEEGMDSGPIQRKAALEIDPNEDAPGLFERLNQLGLRELDKTLEELSAGTVRREAQLGEPTLAPKIEPSEARIDFDIPARDFHNKVRGLRAGPRAFSELKLPGRSAPSRLTLLKTKVELEEPGEAADRALTRGSVTEPSGEEMPPPGSVGGRPASEAVGAAV